MKRVSDLFRESKGPIISFEIFPPKTPQGEETLLNRVIPSLLELKPGFFSVTYGAGGSTRTKTAELVRTLISNFQTNVVAHLTCIVATKSEINELLNAYQVMGCKNILALRGDVPKQTDYHGPKGEFRYAIELVQYIRTSGDFCIGVAGFPEGHPECKEGKYANWRHLIQKIQAGAEFVITQLFFDNQDFFEFRDFIAKYCPTTPIIPGIIPITSSKQIIRFTELCGAKIPKKIADVLEKWGDNDTEVSQFGTEYAIKQCEELLSEGAPGLHLYTLNRSEPISTIVSHLNLKQRG